MSKPVKLTPNARLALDVAVDLGGGDPANSADGTPALLIGLITAGGSFSSRFLIQEALRPEAAPRFGHEDGAGGTETKALASLVVAASRVAEAMEHSTIGTEHLLLAILKADGPVTRLLSDRGITETVVRNHISQGDG